MRRTLLINRKKTAAMHSGKTIRESFRNSGKFHGSEHPQEASQAR